MVSLGAFILNLIAEIKDANGGLLFPPFSKNDEIRCP